MIAIGASGALNHVLSQQHWALERLRPFAGMVVEFRADPLPAFRLAILPSGHVEPAREATVDLTVGMRPGALPRLLARGEAAIGEVEFSGPDDLAGAVRELYRHLEWDLEEDLSRIFGDVLAHRIASTGREILEWPRQAGLRVAQNVTEYWTEERPVLARPADFSALARAIEGVREDCAQLERRIARLEASVTQKH
ncbi:MAG: hypothetical protein HYY28_11655 [Betaproteobacteria bacterium]|nr:hypothetical protein [Betaproteobacteria bacterium]MBI2960962.1 hypothetical protein [Betaproteobacteria bacterium]